MLGCVSCSKEKSEVIIKNTTKDTVVKSEIINVSQTIDVYTSLPESGKVFFYYPGNTTQIVNCKTEGKSSLVFTSSEPDILVGDDGTFYSTRYCESTIYAIYQNEIIAQYTVIPLGGSCVYGPIDQYPQARYNNYTDIASADKTTHTLFFYDSPSKISNTDELLKMDRMECVCLMGTTSIESAKLIADGISYEVDIKEQSFSNHFGKNKLNIEGTVQDREMKFTYIDDIEIISAK